MTPDPRLKYAARGRSMSKVLEEPTPQKSEDYEILRLASRVAVVAAGDRIIKALEEEQTAYRPFMNQQEIKIFNLALQSAIEIVRKETACH